jgi:hypothetical protein
MKMANDKQLSTSEVQRLTKQGDKDVLFAMRLKLDEILPGKYNSIERTAWNNIWLAKAAEAGHADAKYQMAHAFYRMSYNGAAVEYRQKAFRYYEELSNNFDNGKLDEVYRGLGKNAKIWLGIFLCMGSGLTLRDVKKGIEYIEEAKTLTNDFKDYGFRYLHALVVMYAEVYAQLDEIPSKSDLEKAVEYLSASLDSSKTKKIDQSDIEYEKKYLEDVREDLANKVIEEENSIISSNIQLLNSLAEFKRLKAIERRIKNMELPYEKQKQLKDYEAAIKQLRECIEIKGL